MFEYPMSLKVGDKIVLRDEDRTWSETVMQEPTRHGDKVEVWTDARLLHCDPGLKVQITRPR